MVTLIVVMMFAGPCDGWEYDCANGDYSPCSCEDFTVYCRNTLAATVKSMFSRITTSHLYAFYFFLPFFGTEDSNTLTTDLIGNDTTFKFVTINCLWFTSPLVIDANAFRSTKSVTIALFIQSCDLSQLNWSFISNFTSLEYLESSDNYNFIASFYTLPSASLPRLTQLWIDNSFDLNDGFQNLSLRYPEPLKQGLHSLRINYIQDFALNCFLIKWVTPYSKNTLEFLDISLNNLSKIPNEIRNYKNLASVRLGSNQRPLTIQKNAFDLKKNTLLDQRLVFSNVISIQPGAFQGRPIPIIIN